MRNRSAPLTAADLDTIDWNKGGGLVPAIVQDARTLQMLMLGYMNREALAQTLSGGLVTFFSRSRDKLWVKGETSGNHLMLVSAHTDCDSDALLVLADPVGPACHLETTSCFSEDEAPGIGWLPRLAQIVASRKGASPDSSYTAKLFAKGPRKIAQKVGEEGVEVALAGAALDAEELKQEAADLLYHLLVLLETNGVTLEEVMAVLRERHGGKKASAPPSPLRGEG
jgi:phosphoribosyl-ATP pyrophosphohydrolase/phosphoribosyl-AMP cyclohydrolase